MLVEVDVLAAEAEQVGVLASFASPVKCTRITLFNTDLYVCRDERALSRKFIKALVNT